MDHKANFVLPIFAILYLVNARFEQRPYLPTVTFNASIYAALDGTFYHLFFFS